jgi:hypothetical protein
VREKRKPNFNQQQFENVQASLLKLTDSLVRQFVLKGLDLDDDARRSFALFSQTICTKLNYAESICAERLLNRQKKNEVTLVSLGYDCLPRTMLAKYGLIASRADGRLTMPFDLAVHPIIAVKNLISTDFGNYALSENISFAKQGHAIIPQLGVHLNHDIPTAEMEDPVKEIVKRIDRRVRAFRGLKKSRKLIFVHHVQNATPNDCIELLGLLKRYFPKKEVRLIVVDTRHNASPARPSSQDIDWILSPRPYPEYRWHDEACCASVEGRLFERRIIGEITNIIDRL